MLGKQQTNNSPLLGVTQISTSLPAQALQAGALSIVHCRTCSQYIVFVQIMAQSLYITNRAQNQQIGLLDAKLNPNRAALYPIAALWVPASSCSSPQTFICHRTCLSWMPSTTNQHAAHCLLKSIKQKRITLVIVPSIQISVTPQRHKHALRPS
jgi:hypothetical protein